MRRFSCACIGLLGVACHHGAADGSAGESTTTTTTGGGETGTGGASTGAGTEGPTSSTTGTGSMDPEGSSGGSEGGESTTTTTGAVGESSGSSDETGVVDGDEDGDGVPDDADNCVGDVNPGQEDGDGDGIGDVCDEDDDGDGIPDDDDVFPGDGDKPGSINSSRMYAHSSSTLWSVDVATYEPALIGDFVWPNGVDQMTDLAIDRHGQLFGVSFGGMYVCHPVTAVCWALGGLPASYNGLTFVPAGTLLPDKDALIGISEEGDWYHLTIADQMVTAEKLGGYGGQYSSAGDAFSIEGVGTFAAVYKVGVNTTVIVSVDPLTGKVLADLAVLPLSTVWGLAGWEGAIVAFDFTGDMAKVDPMTKEITLLGNKPSEWWGAAVSTVLPQ